MMALAPDEPARKPPAPELALQKYQGSGAFKPWPAVPPCLHILQLPCSMLQLPSRVELQMLQLPCSRLPGRSASRRSCSAACGSSAAVQTVPGGARLPLPRWRRSVTHRPLRSPLCHRTRHAVTPEQRPCWVVEQPSLRQLLTVCASAAAGRPPPLHATPARQHAQHAQHANGTQARTALS